MFNTTPLIELAAVIKIPANRRKRALEHHCLQCLREFEKVGNDLADFATSVENDPDLFQFLATVLRSAKKVRFKFASTAQLHSELGSVRNVIRKIRNGSTKADYDLLLSFSGAIEDAVRAKLRQAA